MGTNMYFFIEVVSQDKSVDAWAHGALSLARDYGLFAALAGVRSKTPPLFSPRGLPLDLSSEVFENYYRFILSPADLSSHIWNGYASVDPATAAHYIEKGVSHAPPPGYVKYNLTSPLGYVSDPDFHTPGWLWDTEIHQALAAHCHTPRADFLVILDVMESIRRRFPAKRARAIFWFVN